MSLFLDALLCKQTPRPPVWLMRQAGRYMSSYRELRQEHSLFSLFHDPKMIETITCQPVDVFKVDAAILFSDILTVFDGLGVKYDFLEGVGPIVKEAAFREVENPYLHIDTAIRSLKKKLSVPLIGFAGGPFTVLSYLIEGKTSREFVKIKSLMYQDPQQFKELLDRITTETLIYLDVQIAAGVDVIQIFDSWAHVLDMPAFEKYVMGPLEKIVTHLKSQQVPTILFCRNSSYFAQELAQLKPNAISLDWNADIVKLREQIPSSIALQGNFDPFLLFAPKDVIQRRVEEVLEKMSSPGYIVNLGHGVHRLTLESHVKTFVDTVRNFSRATVSI